jgi:hypothetical protein
MDGTGKQGSLDGSGKLRRKNKLPNQNVVTNNSDCPSLQDHCNNAGVESTSCNSDPCCCWSGPNHSCSACGNPQGPCGINGTWDEWYSSGSGVWVESSCQGPPSFHGGSNFGCNAKVGCKDPIALNYDSSAIFCCGIGWDYTGNGIGTSECCCYSLPCDVLRHESQQTSDASREVRRGGSIRKYKKFGRR